MTTERSDQLTTQRCHRAFNRAKADGDVLLARQLLAHDVRVAGMPMKPLAQPLRLAVQLLRPRRRALQAEYAAWCDALPDSLRDTATAAALQAIVDLDLDELTTIVPPRGYGRD